MVHVDVRAISLVSLQGVQFCILTDSGRSRTDREGPTSKMPAHGSPCTPNSQGLALIVPLFMCPYPNSVPHALTAQALQSQSVIVRARARL